MITFLHTLTPGLHSGGFGRGIECLIVSSRGREGGATDQPSSKSLQMGARCGVAKEEDARMVRPTARPPVEGRSSALFESCFPHLSKKGLSPVFTKNDFREK